MTAERCGIFMCKGKKQHARCTLLFKAGVHRLTHKTVGLRTQSAAGRHVAALLQGKKNALEEKESLR